MADVIHIMRVVNIKTEYDKEGNVHFTEHATIQRTGDLQNFEITYDGDENRRLVNKWQATGLLWVI